MNKVILVIDEPKVCSDCPLFSCEFTCCNYTHNKLDIFDDKLSDCPLKSLPTKMSATANANLDLICNMSNEECKIYNVGYTQGRNNCIEEILGEIE